MDNTMMWVLVGVLAAVLIVGGIFLLMPKERYIEVDGVKIWMIPDDAEVTFINQAQANAVKSLKQKNQLVAFVGEAQGTGTAQDQEVAKIRAFQQVAEFLNAKVTTFAQLVEGQLQNVQVSGKKQDIVSASVSAYKRVSELFAQGRVSGAYVFAVWRVKKGNIVNTYSLLVYDPGAILKLVELDAQVQRTVEELGKQGVDFFKNLNDVMMEATKGTPMQK
ncbi:MAG: hypothetical protein N2Z58_08430 [Fervidobacterium sp.]|nr:hypothetical protein [Fervidobacterium sp.]